MPSTRICFIGAGNFARYVHGPMLKEIAARDAAVECAAVCDLNAERAETFARDFGFQRSYTDPALMLHQEQPDGVVVLTQVAATAQTAGKVLAAGYPVMMEKPPGRNRAEIEHLIAMRQQGQAPAMVAFNRRYSPWLNRARELLAETGEPLEQIRCEFCRHERLDDDFSTTAIHGIDAVRHLVGSPYSRVSLHYRELQREKPACDITIQAEFANGTAGLICFSPSTGLCCERFTLLTRHWTLVLESVIPGGGSDRPGRLFVYHDGKLLRIEAPAPHPLQYDDRYLAGYYGEHAAFIHRLRHGFPEENDLELSLDAVEIADALRHRAPHWSHA